MADPDATRIQKLERDVAEIANQLAELRQQLAATRAGGFQSIRDSRRCPACGSGALLHVVRAKAHNERGPMDFSIAHEYSLWSGTKPLGGLEVFACRQCGLAEWHVLDFAAIPVDGRDIIAIEPEGEPPASGPFR
jgi:ribosomal protein S27AE